MRRKKQKASSALSLRTAKAVQGQVLGRPLDSLDAQTSCKWGIAEKFPICQRWSHLEREWIQHDYVWYVQRSWVCACWIWPVGSCYSNGQFLLDVTSYSASTISRMWAGTSNELCSLWSFFSCVRFTGHLCSRQLECVHPGSSTTWDAPPFSSQLPRSQTSWSSERMRWPKGAADFPHPASHFWSRNLWTGPATEKVQVDAFVWEENANNLRSKCKWRYFQLVKYTLDLETSEQLAMLGCHHLACCPGYSAGGLCRWSLSMGTTSIRVLCTCTAKLVASSILKFKLHRFFLVRRWMHTVLFQEGSEWQNDCHIPSHLRNAQRHRLLLWRLVQWSITPTENWSKCV